jgi:phage host-nuclease inhibitor protein Gam
VGRPIKPSAVLGSIEECNGALRRLLLATLRRERLQCDREQAVVVATHKYEESIAKALAEEKDLGAQLQHYYMGHLAELEKDGRKSVELTYGVMGRRASPPALKLLNKAWTWGLALVKLQEKFGRKYLRLKDPEIDKEAVKQEIAPERLKEFGLRLEQEEVFYAEPDRKRAEEDLF